MAITVKVPVFRIGAEFCAQFPSRKINATKTGMESYAAQARESNTDNVVKRVASALNNKGLRFVALTTPEPIAKEPGGDTMELIGHVTDDDGSAAPAAKPKTKTA